jgi:hypothetical protein
VKVLILWGVHGNKIYEKSLKNLYSQNERKKQGKSKIKTSRDQRWIRHTLKHTGKKAENFWFEKESER